MEPPPETAAPFHRCGLDISGHRHLHGHLQADMKLDTSNGRDHGLLIYMTQKCQILLSGLT